MLAAIAAVDEDFGLGNEGHLQFHIREDLKRFQSITKGHTVIYGRKTLETFPGGEPLKNRRNIIPTMSPSPSREEMWSPWKRANSSPTKPAA